MELEVKLTCPLGSTCEKVVDDHIERCMWYVKLAGTDPQNGEQVDSSRCAIAWQPILVIEGNGVNHRINSSLQSLRNETIKRQDAAIKVIGDAQAITSQ